MIEITGNTYPVRYQLKALGCRWNAARKCWLAPTEAIAAQARELVANAPKVFRGGTKSRSHMYPSRPPRTCATCGCRINYGVSCGKCEFGR